MNLSEIPRVKSISRSEFTRLYLKTQSPVVIENLTHDWPAYKIWNLDYIKKVAGNRTVPLYDDRPVNFKEGFNEAHAHMKMSDYIDLLKSQPTKYRIFLWNILKEIPELQQDFVYPELGLKFMKGLPMLFFGGKDSHTFMHYDIDLANIFHFHFDGEKDIILFDQKQNKYIYKIPHSLITREDIDFSEPDLSKWPALSMARGYKTTLSHGEVLFMPEGYWHYMKYKTPGFSMSLRSIPKNPKHLMKAIYNVFVMRNFDTMMRRLQGQKWINWKNEQAVLRTNKVLDH